jgi:hypothetical protein
MPTPARSPPCRSSVLRRANPDTGEIIVLDSRLLPVVITVGRPLRRPASTQALGQRRHRHPEDLCLRSMAIRGGINGSAQAVGIDVQLAPR